MTKQLLIEDINSIVGEYFQSLINECDDIGELSNIYDTNQSDFTHP